MKQPELFLEMGRDWQVNLQLADHSGARIGPAPVAAAALPPDRPALKW